MQFLPRYQILEAVPVGALEEAGAVTAQREYIVTFDDGTRGVLDRFTFEALFCRSNDAGAGSAPEPAARGGGPRKVADGKPGGTPAVRKPAKAARQEPAQVVLAANHFNQGEPAKKILAALSKRPMSSAELSQETGLAGSPLYSTCNNLKTRGQIVSFTDDAGDGTRRYRLPISGGAA